MNILDYTKKYQYHPSNYSPFQPAQVMEAVLKKYGVVDNFGFKAVFRLCGVKINSSAYTLDIDSIDINMLPRTFEELFQDEVPNKELTDTDDYILKTHISGLDNTEDDDLIDTDYNGYTMDLTVEIQVSKRVLEEIQNQVIGEIYTSLKETSKFKSLIPLFVMGGKYQDFEDLIIQNYVYFIDNRKAELLLERAFLFNDNVKMQIQEKMAKLD